MMLALASIGLLLCVGIGVMAVAWWWPEPVKATRSWLLIASVGAAVGIGLTSGLYYLWLNTLAHLGVTYEIVEWAAVALAGVGLWHGWQQKNKTGGPESASQASTESWQSRLPGYMLLASAGVVTVSAMVSLTALLAADPQGQWDAWAMWNFKAGFLYLGGADWTDLFRVTPHPDYPLLHPIAVARLWVYCGTVDVSGPQLLSWAALLLTVGVLIGAVWRLRGPMLGAAAGIVLMTTPLVIKRAAAQYTDTTLGLFMLGAVALLVVAWEQEQAKPRARILLLAGVMASAAAWTKNEGIAFAMMLILFTALRALPGGVRPAGRALAPLLLGMLPLGLCLLSQKLFYAGQTDLLEPRSFGQIMALVVDADRHRLILSTLWQPIRHMPPWPAVVLAGLLIAVNGVRFDRRGRANVLCATGILLAQVLCYYVIYLTSIPDLKWLLETTADRLVIQLWPSLIFLLFLPAREPVCGEAGVQALAG